MIWADPRYLARGVGIFKNISREMLLLNMKRKTVPTELLKNMMVNKT